MRVFGLAALTFALVAEPALGQTTPPPAPPPPQTPAQTGVPTRDQLRQPELVPPESTARVDSRGSFKNVPCALADSPLRVTINRVTFAPVGRTELPPEIVDILNGVHLETAGDQLISNICTIRDNANTALRAKGYVASVQIPPQDVAEGELKLVVVLARITDVRVRGEPGPHRALLETRIAQIKKLDPVNEHDIERLLLLTGDIPGLDVQLSLRPAGTAPGDVVGDLIVQSNRFAVYGNIENFGSKQLGRETLYTRVEGYGLLTGADMLYAAGSTSFDFKQQRVGQLGYQTVLNSSGTSVGIRGTYATSRPDLDTLDLRTESIIAGLDVTQPLIRSVRRNLAVTGGFEFLDQRTNVFGGSTATPLNKDETRVLFLRANGGIRAPHAGRDDDFSLIASVEVRKGIDILGASQRGVIAPDGASLSRFEGDPQATVIRGSADMEVGLGPIFTLSGAVRAQWANHPLLNLEEFSIGNLTIGRGYDPGANSGDRAVGLRGEVGARLPLGLPVVVRLMGFFDAVWLWNLDTNTTESYRVLTSYGGGINVQLPGTLAIDLLYAKPRNKALSFDDAPPPGRLLFSITARFNPYVR